LADVIESGNIRCVGFATMYKAIIDELGMPELSAELCALFGSGKDGHAVNVVSIKDEKYGIDGEYMQDACFSALAVDRDKNDFMYCLYPVDDISRMYDENYRVVKNINMLSFYDLEHTHSLRLAKMSKEEANQFLEASHSEFLSGLKKKGEAIDVEKYATAYYETLIRNGVPEEKAKEIVDKKINYTIARASITLSEESQSRFISDKLTEEFLEENLSEYEFINFGIKEFEREDLDKLPAEQREEILVLLQQMRKRRKELLMTEEEGNKRNRKIIKEILEKN
jgi:arsenate reductase-like glutaredoxin family protein